MSDLHHEHRQVVIIDRVDDTEVALPNAVLILAGELFASRRAAIAQS